MPNSTNDSGSVSNSIKILLAILLPAVYSQPITVNESGRVERHLQSGGPEQEPYENPPSHTPLRVRVALQIKAEGPRRVLSVVDFRLKIKHWVLEMCHGITGLDN